MSALIPREPFSYRQDTKVPDFNDSGPITVVDGDCALCTVAARLIARFDRALEFRICPLQTELGSALLRHYGLEISDPESWLYIVDGSAYTSLDGMIRAGARVGGAGWLLQPLRLMPASMQDWIYQKIARNRYRLFGRKDMCAVPDPALCARLIE
jgi:predicted DCC family thiol-disulfide oxidoreductase YuxK